MINKIYNYQLIFILFIFYSCSKEYNSIGTDILKSDTFNTSVENIPVYATQKLISPFKSNGLSSYQLGQINDNIFGKFESSFITQLRLCNMTLYLEYGILIKKKMEINNIKVIQENENELKWFRNTFFNNTIDSDGDGVMIYMMLIVMI